MINNIIFLDVDGPLNTDDNVSKQIRLRKPTSSFFIELPKGPILNLKHILYSVPDTKIVLSSNWRLGGSPSMARLNLERQIHPYGIYIYDETPNMGKRRALEIKTWLNKFSTENGYVPPFIILDNEINCLTRHFKGHIINCNHRKGLTWEASNISINVLYKFRNQLVH